MFSSTNDFSCCLLSKFIASNPHRLTIFTY
jgi:hypothetical protein